MNQKDELFSVGVSKIKKESKQREGNPEEANFIDKACTFQGKEMMVSPKIMRTKMRTRFFFLRERREEAAERLQFYIATRRFFHGQNTYKRHSEMRLFHCHGRSSSDGQKKQAERHLSSARHLKRAKRKHS